MDSGTAVKRMRLRYDGLCSCGALVPAGTDAGWVAAEKRVFCPACLQGMDLPGKSPSPEIPPTGNSPASRAGASLQAEYERRMAVREDRVKGRFPRIGPLLLAMFDEAPSTRAFKTGAEGERKAVKAILERAGDQALLMVNRRLGPGRRDGDIDIIAVTAAGVHVIDVKHYPSAKVTVERTGGLFGPRTEQLKVRGRDASGLLDSMEKQVAAARAALSAAAEFAVVPVSAAMCFVEADLPLTSTPVARGIQCLGPKQTGRWLRNATGPLSPATRDKIFGTLDAALPPASPAAKT